VIIVIVGVGFLLVYLLFMRPQKKRQLQQQHLLDELRVGDEVLTAGGIYGTISELDDDQVTVEIAPTVEVRVSRRAIAGVTPDAAEDETPELEEPEDDESSEPEPSIEENRG
jgi:preprotein translocase subunit YajC